ncbi:hypothetical protein HOU67_gp54 [Escherichia phage Skarpretter]|uniref:Uncharacterized protein n=1 Tax=Escherichia phage Skarpretter TaxID=2488654 RepID=A0A3G8F2Y3_9CAUD|nr:hypothetical protein HOU67_gp54 [Escherichia phage Skarpretter]AZF88690.1 hypothetical protein [Escherichia phage Skarpretter]
MENQKAVTVEKFARLYEVHGRQFLVKKGKDSDDNPKLSIITQIDGAEVDFGFCFPDNDQGWEGLDHAFAKEPEILEVVNGFGEKIKDCKTAIEVMFALRS